MKDIRDFNITEFTSFAKNELISITDFQLLIIKGHLIVEFSINCYLESISKSKTLKFFDDKFTFSHKIKMLDHFGSIGHESNNLIEELILLNKLRNEIAHKLRF